MVKKTKGGSKGPRKQKPLGTIGKAKQQARADYKHFAQQLKVTARELGKPVKIIRHSSGPRRIKPTKA